jgi:hypothetical protein
MCALQGLSTTAGRQLLQRIVMCTTIFMTEIRVVKAVTSYSGGAGFKSLTQRLEILSEICRSFPQSLQANAGIIP